MNTLQRIKRDPSYGSSINEMQSFVPLPESTASFSQPQSEPNEQLHTETDSLLGPSSIKKPTSVFDFGSLLLENKGTVARDHLASERTFLAWLRTSLSLASAGVAVAQLLKLGSKGDSEILLPKMSKALGLCFMSIAIITMCIGTFRYFVIQRLLTTNEFPASRFGVGLLFLSVMLISITIFVIVMTL